MAMIANLAEGFRLKLSLPKHRPQPLIIIIIIPSSHSRCGYSWIQLNPATNG
jgi:hypothetical protein